MTDIYRIDSHKLAFHPQRVAQWMNAETWEEAKKVYPIYWEITTSAACNHRCTFCSTDAIGYPAILMDAEILVKRMREAQALGVKSVMFGGTGEPLVHKKLSGIVQHAVSYRLDVGITTNGVLLDKLSPISYCTWIKISLNAGSRENYARIHRTDEKDWDKVWKNIEEAIPRKYSCALGVQCVVLPENYHEMMPLAKRCRGYGVDYLVLKPYTQATFSIVQRGDIDYTDIHKELLMIPGLYDTEKFKVIVRTNAMREEMDGSHHYDKCRATPMFWTYSMADGRMFSCSAHLMDDRFCIGNLNTQSFQEIWEGEGRRKNWEMMKEFDIKQCRLNCRMNGPNKYLHDLAKGVPHGNFI